MRKVFIIAVILSASAIGATAQAQNNCRDISAGGFLQPDEVLVQTTSGYMACRAVKPAAPASNEVVAASSATAAAPMPAAKAALPDRTVYTRDTDEGRAPMVQVAGGYQYNSLNFSGNISGINFSSDRVSTNGAFAQVMVNVNRYISPVGSVDISYKSYEGSNYLLAYMGGVQAYPLARGKWSPFGRVMFGAGTLHVSGLGSETGFEWQVGGGLDWRLSRERRLALRLGTFDYARVSKDGVNANSLKIGTGIVF